MVPLQECRKNICKLRNSESKTVWCYSAYLQEHPMVAKHRSISKSSCKLIAGCQGLGVTFALHLQMECIDSSRRFFRIIDNHEPDYTASQPRQHYDSSPLWPPKYQKILITEKWLEISYGKLSSKKTRNPTHGVGRPSNNGILIKTAFCELPTEWDVMWKH
jgi:hypothetical protein